MAKTFAGTVHLSSENQAVNETHEIVSAHYSVALSIFTDTILTQAMGDCFLGSEGSLEYVSTMFVGRELDKELYNLARLVSEKQVV